jgi:hypothetical protein
MTERRCRWLIAGAILWYCVWAILLIQTKPGFHYDEAIDVRGSVSLLHSHADLTLPHAPETWHCINGYCFPLMSARYIGAIKEWLCLPLFAIFGPHAQVVRLLAMTLGALGIFGIALLLARQSSYAVAAAGAWILAVNPSYLDMTILDNSAFSPWMCAVGLLCIASSAYLDHPNPRKAFWLGAAIGFGVWARANFVWMLGALALALLIAAGRRLLRPISEWVALALGGIVGGLPFLAYQVLSGGGTWEAVSMLPVSGTWTQRLQHRLWMLAETVLSNGEHHRIWGGPITLPAWQLWLFPMIIVASWIVCIFLKRGLLARVAALTLVFYIAMFLYASLPVGEHHLMTLLPIAVVVVVLAWRQPEPHWALGLLAVVYTASAIYWSSSALAGLRRTGGVGAWSDAIYVLTNRLNVEFPGQEIKVLDWGLQNNIYVLSDGRVRTRELFWDSTLDRTDRNEPWIDEIRHGGVFLFNGPKNRQIPAATTGFLRALAGGRPTLRRYTVSQKDGVPYAEVIDIAPDTLGTGPAPPPDPAVPSWLELKPGEADFLNQSTGFYILEQGGWRWTMREFSLIFPANRPAANLTLHVNVPEAAIQKLGPITLTLSAGDHVLPPETFSRAGDFTVTRSLEPGWGNRFTFSVDKTLPPTASDTRELGVIFVGAKLDFSP